MTSIDSLFSSYGASYADPAKSSAKKSKEPEAPSSYDASKDPLLMLQKSIKSFKDEHYSGLTDEEKAKIEKEIKDYLAAQKKLGKTPENFTEEEAEAFQAFVKSLRKKYGYKGDSMEDAAADALGVVSKSQNALQYKFQTEMKVKDFDDFDERLKEEKKEKVLF